MNLQARGPAAGHIPVRHGGVHAGDPAGVADFSSSITPAGMPARVRSALRRGLGEAQDYPDPRCTRLVAGLAAYTGLPRSRLVAGNGAVEIIYNFCASFVRGRPVLVAAPTFGEYEAASRLAGCGRVSSFESASLGDDLDGFVSEIPRNGCVFVCNPNNPTGELLTRRQVSEVAAAAAERSSAAFVDECFMELVPGRRESVLGLVRRRDNLVVLRSLTKSFGLAGIRVGYAACPAEVASVLDRVRIPWSVNAPAQRAALAAIGGSRRHLERSREIVRAESAFLQRRIAAIPGLECRGRPAANFVLIRTRRNSDALRAELLRKHRILVRDCRGFAGLDGSHHIRIAVRPHRDNVRLVRALEAAA